jgi:integrase
VLLHGVSRRAQKVYRLPRSPVAGIERHPRARVATSSSSASRGCTRSRAASSERHAAIPLTAALTGLRRGELVVLRWRDIDFAASAIRVRASYAGGALTTPKSGRVRAVPMAPDVAEILARLRRRGYLTGDDDLVFSATPETASTRRSYGAATTARSRAPRWRRARRGSVSARCWPA